MSDQRVSLVAIVDGETWVRSATVVRRDVREVHLATDEPLPLPFGHVVGLMCHATDDRSAAVDLAVVADSVGDTVTALRLVERRR